MRPPREIRAELDAAYRAVWRLLDELPGDCHRHPDGDVFEALRNSRHNGDRAARMPGPAPLFDGHAWGAPGRTEENHGRDDG